MKHLLKVLEGKIYEMSNDELSFTQEQQEKDELSCLSIQQMIKSYGDSSLFMTKAMTKEYKLTNGSKIYLEHDDARIS